MLFRSLIERFSEDIDITVFREDIGEDASVEALEAMSGKKRQAKLDAIKAACQAFIGGDLLAQLSMTLADAITAAGPEPGQPRVELDADDASRPSLLLWYPHVPETQRTQGTWLPWHNSTKSAHRAQI